MRKRLFHVWTIAALMILSMVIGGIVFRVNQKDCGITGWKRIEELPDGIRVNYAMDSSREEVISESNFEEGKEWQGLDTAPIIAVVSPTGKLDLFMGCLQEFTVKEVIKGDDFISEGQKGYISTTFGFYLDDGNVEYNEVINLMQPEYEYLVFMEESPLNHYQKKDIYYITSDYFGCVRTDNHSTETLDEDYQKYDFLDLKEYEFFSTSEKLTETMNHIMEKIRDRYLCAVTVLALI